MGESTFLPFLSTGDGYKFILDAGNSLSLDSSFRSFLRRYANNIFFSKITAS